MERKYYDLKTCKEKVKKCFRDNGETFFNTINLLVICDILCRMDANFPPVGLWENYYNSENLCDIVLLTKINYN